MHATSARCSAHRAAHSLRCSGGLCVDAQIQTHDIGANRPGGVLASAWCSVAICVLFVWWSSGHQRVPLPWSPRSHDALALVCLVSVCISQLHRAFECFVEFDFHAAVYALLCVHWASLVFAVAYFAHHVKRVKAQTQRSDSLSSLDGVGQPVLAIPLVERNRVESFTAHDRVSRSPSNANGAHLHSEPMTTRQKLGFFIAYLVDTMYFPLLTRFLQVFNCSTFHDPALLAPLHFLQRWPYVSCDTPEYHKLFWAAMLGTITCGVGAPAFFLYHIFRDRRSLHASPVRHEMSFLWSSIRPELHWFPAVIYLRKIAIAIIITQLPFGSVLVPMLVFALLAGLIVMQLFFAPYVVPADNGLEVGLLTLALFTYMCGILVGVGRLVCCVVHRIAHLLCQRFLSSYWRLCCLIDRADPERFGEGCHRFPRDQMVLAANKQAIVQRCGSARPAG